MGAKTNYAEEQLVGVLFRGAAFTPPAAWHVALFTAVTDGEAGTVTEVSGGSYARVVVANSAVEWTAPVGGDGTTSNVNPIAFPVPTAAWGQATHWGLFDPAGNLWYYDDLTTPKTINNGDPAPTFAAGALTVQEDN
ncbi:MAG: hypothetical protein M3H12_18790 [Chromatiales bacterium]|nr:hypothetical protein [Gammaproteobacteria bacterium]